MKHIIVKLGQKITPSVVEQIRQETAKEIFIKLDKITEKRLISKEDGSYYEPADIESWAISYQKLKKKFGGAKWQLFKQG